jgi:hypothetical protein
MYGHCLKTSNIPWVQVIISVLPNRKPLRETEHPEHPATNKFPVLRCFSCQITYIPMNKCRTRVLVSAEKRMCIVVYVIWKSLKRNGLDLTL